MSENIRKNQNKWQKLILIMLGGALGVILLVVSGGMEMKKNTDADGASTESPYTDADAYAAMLETRVAEICSGVAGAGKVSVFVSLKGGYRTVYAVDSQSGSSGYKNEIVMSGSGSDKKAVITAYENPEIAGVGIVCEGADNAEVRSQLISLVSAALNISTNKIYIAR